jgi:hypothetical protein
MKSTIILDVMPCSLVEVCGRFGRMYCIHFQRQIRQASNQQEAEQCLLRLLVDPEDGGYMFPLNAVNFNLTIRRHSPYTTLLSSP